MNFRSLAILKNIVHILCMHLRVYLGALSMFVTKVVKLSNLYEFLILLNYKKFWSQLQ